MRARIDHDIGRDAEDRAMAERGAAGEACQEIDRHGEDAEDQHFGGEPDLVGRKAERQHGGGEQDAA
jgi:hypothetical protein